MLPKILRLGPLFLLQVGLILSSLYTRYIGNFSQCRMLALITISAILFLFEMFVVYRIIQKSKKLRKKYMTELVLMKQIPYYSTSVWNGLMVAIPIIYLYTIIVIDGISLGSFKKNQPECQNQCQFMLFPLCMYNSTFGKQISMKDQIMVLGLLYACFLAAVSILAAIVCKEMTKFYMIIIKNRKYAKIADFSMFQSLLNCEVIYLQHQSASVQHKQFMINQSFAEKQDKRSKKLKLTQQAIKLQHRNNESCPICLKCLCLRQNAQNKIQSISLDSIIQLQCRHRFHKRCIINWLQIKDSCPFRCGQE